MCSILLIKKCSSEADKILSKFENDRLPRIIQALFNLLFNDAYRYGEVLYSPACNEMWLQYNCILLHMRIDWLLLKLVMYSRLIAYSEITMSETNRYESASRSGIMRSR
jgi:hypothetical protein